MAHVMTEPNATSGWERNGTGSEFEIIIDGFQADQAGNPVLVSEDEHDSRFELVTGWVMR